MGRLRGHVDRADKLLIAGWALDEDQPEVRPLVQVSQRGQVVAATRSFLPLPQLRASLSLPASPHPPFYGWQIALPLANGIAPDLPFSVTVVGAADPAANGTNRVIRTVERMDREAEADLAAAPLVQLDYHTTGEGVRFNLRATQGAEERDLTLAIGRQTPPRLEVRSLPAAPPFGRRGLRFTAMIPRRLLTASPRLALPLRLRFPGDETDTRANFHHRLRGLFLPRSLYDAGARRLPVPDEAVMRRVLGPRTAPAQYLAGGITTFLQIDALARRATGRAITEFACVVDASPGCGRVLRHFAESAEGLGLPPPAPEGRRLVALDPDPASLAWCRGALEGLAEFRPLPRGQRFDLPEASVDLLYGPGALGALGEFEQQLWLAEARRVLRPGGLAIVSVNAEAAACRQPTGLALPFVERFGLFDAVEDPAAGPEGGRMAFVGRGYIRTMWSRHLQVLEVVPAAAEGFLQDWVVLRRRAG
jgi:SAM-dependent methyltransferase